MNRPPRFVAFYSYKGGVGRTLALANVAWDMVSRGKNVLLVDFDLEAPGLDHFRAFRGGRTSRKGPAAPREGVVEYLRETLARGEPPERLDAYCHRCASPPPAPDYPAAGELWLMPAGRHDQPDYTEFLQEFDWNDFYARRDGWRLMEHLRGHLAEHCRPDYVLMDARTGYTEIGGVVTRQLADMVVMLFNLNDQSLAGSQQVYEALIRQESKPPRVLPVVSPIPAVPTGKGSPFARHLARIARWGGKDHTVPPVQVIPYQSSLAMALEEVLLNDPDDPFASVTPYRQLAAWIERHANDPDAALERAAQRMARDDKQGAMAILDDALEQHPDQARLWSMKGTLEHDNGNLQGAVTAWRRAIKAGEEDPSLRFRLGVALNQLQRPEEAMAAYQALLRHHGDAPDPKTRELCAQALFNLGVTLGQLDRPEEAIGIYRQLLERYGDDPAHELRVQCAKALHNLGITLGQLDRPEEAIEIYRQVLERYGDDEAARSQVTGALANGAELLLVSGRIAEALEWLHEVRARCGRGDQESAIVPFLAWLAEGGEGETTLGDVLRAIDALEPGVSFTWNFEEVAGVIAALPEPARDRARCLVDFFEGRRGRHDLVACLEG